MLVAKMAHFFTKLLH